MAETLLDIMVHPQKPKFGFSRMDADSNAWHVHVTAAPQKDAANRELVKECSRLFGVPVRIVRGLTSKRKVIRIPLARANVEQILRK